MDNLKQAVNPYLPSWEYVPDGEPYVFGDRVYVYGSHDFFQGDVYCMGDYVGWSAPADNLGDWRYEGVIYRKDQDPGNGDLQGNLYAPDVTVGPDGRYYLYYVLSSWDLVSVAVCDEPAGKYEFYGYVHYPDGTRLGEKEGDAIDIETGKVIGRHKGYWFHTIGQRKGLGFGGGPWFVVKKDIERNILYLAKGYDTTLQYGDTFTLADFHILTANPYAELGTYDIRFKIRHTERPVPGKLLHTAEGWLVKSSSPIQGIAPGQFGVIYDAEGNRCIGSGEIGV